MMAPENNMTAGRGPRDDDGETMTVEAGQGDEDNNNGDRDGDGDKTTGRGGCNDGPTGAGYFFCFFRVDFVF